MGMLSKIRRHERDQGPQLCSHISLATLARLRKQLGEGPMRFAPRFKESSIAEQIKSLKPKERLAFESIKRNWESRHPSRPFTEDMYLRFARCSPGEPFNVHTACKVMKKYERRHQYLAARNMKEQLLSKAIFPIPDVLTVEGHEVLYMRPGMSAHNKTEEVTDNLVYAVNTMMECEDPCTEGIVCIANMCDWTVTGFATDTCFEFMSSLQNKVPVRVNIFLIVNPPRSFGRIWNLTKPLLAPCFREKVKIVQHVEDLSKYLAEGFQDLLPDDLKGGKASTNDMVADFVTYRIAVEKELGHDLEASASSSSSSLRKAIGRGNSSSRRAPVLRRGSGLMRASSFKCDRSVCSTNSHQQRRGVQRRRSSELGARTMPSSGSSVCSSGSHQQRRSSELQGTYRPPRVQRRASGSAELQSCIRPPQRRASFCSSDPHHLQHKLKQSSKPTKFERRLSDIGARSNNMMTDSSNRSTSGTSTGSTKSVTFEDSTPRNSEFGRRRRRFSGLGSSKAAREEMAPKPVLKRQLSGGTLATDAESTLTSNNSDHYTYTY